MKSIRSFTLVRLATLALLAACFNAGLASAQEAMAGTFTLPFEARWGSAILPAGNYSFTLDHAGSGGILQVSRGTKGVALIQSQSYSTESSGRSELTVVRNSAGTTVRDLSLPAIGEVLHYAPHNPRRSAAAAEQEAALRFPVTAAGK
ncbi:MAG: hypothetical protein ACRD3D_05910 [Terriglobia bacterium]